MGTTVDLIYCAGGNETLSNIAYEEGYQLGTRSDARVKCHAPIFIDINYKKPNFEKHLAVVKEYRPKYATVQDLSEDICDKDDINRALRQIDIISDYCTIPLLVPKLEEQLQYIPAHIAMGYSIPSQYGGAKFPITCLKGRRVHLLGGSPKKQMAAYTEAKDICSIMSIDGNYAQLMAVRYACYWESHKWVKHPLVAEKAKDLYQDCWRRSCRNIIQAWKQIIK